MKMTTSVVALSGLLVGTALGASALFFGFGESHPRPSLSDLLAAPVSNEQVQIYPPGGQFDFARDFSQGALSNRLPIEEEKSDGGVVDLFLRPDRTRQFSVEYFPRAAGQSKGPLRAVTAFAGDGVTKISDSLYDLRGFRREHGSMLANGHYLTTSYFDDGVDPQSLTEVGTGFNSYDPTLQLLKETRWYANHKLAYSSVLNADSSRTILNFDENGIQVGLSRLFPGVVGSTITLYYPGGKQIELESTSDYFTTHVRKFRADGTLELTADISDGILEMVDFDATGRFKTLGQTWFFTRVEEHGIARMTNMRLWTVTETDSQGHDLRSWFWNSLMPGEKGPPTVWSYQEFDKKVEADAHGAYPASFCKRLLYFYRRNDNTLERVDCQSGADNGQDWSVEHTVAEHLMPPAVSQAELILPVLDADLPIPRPQGGRGGR